jgi:hypothetical protein
MIYRTRTVNIRFILFKTVDSPLYLTIYINYFGSQACSEFSNMDKIKASVSNLEVWRHLSAAPDIDKLQCSETQLVIPFQIVVLG